MKPSQNSIGHLTAGAVGKDYRTEGDYLFVPLSNSDSCVAEIYGGSAEEVTERAAFVVRACNAHEQLVSAAKAVRAGWGKNLTGPMAMLMRALDGLPELDAIPRQDKKSNVADVWEAERRAAELADAVVTPEKNTLSMASKVCTALQARNVECHLEYQEWINIPMGDGFYWAFGDMNEYWEGNFNSSEGDEMANLTLDFRNDHQSDGKDIADAIYEALRKFDHHAFGAPPFEPNES